MFGLEKCSITQLSLILLLVMAQHYLCYPLLDYPIMLGLAQFRLSSELLSKFTCSLE